MSTLVSIDPGLRACGVAVFVDGLLVGAHLARNPEKKVRGAPAWDAMSLAVQNELWDHYPIFRGGFGHGNEPGVLVLEQPQVYGGPRGEDPNDLIELAGVDGAILGRLEPRKAVSYLPRQWKGQVDKVIMCRRILKSTRVSDSELAAAGLTRCGSEIGVRHHSIPDSLIHNTIDSIGIGLYFLQRLGV